MVSADEPVQANRLRFLSAIGEVHAADRNGDHVRAGCGMRASYFLKAAILSCSDDESGVESAARDDQLIRHR